MTSTTLTTFASTPTNKFQYSKVFIVAAELAKLRLTDSGECGDESLGTAFSQAAKRAPFCPHLAGSEPLRSNNLGTLTTASR